MLFLSAMSEILKELPAVARNVSLMCKNVELNAFTLFWPIQLVRLQKFNVKFARLKRHSNLNLQKLQKLQKNQLA